MAHRRLSFLLSFALLSAFRAAREDDDNEEEEEEEEEEESDSESDSELSLSVYGRVSV